MRRLGLFGGTFDPPHLGHLMIAEWAREMLELDRVVFMPSGSPPHKSPRGRSPVAARLAMTRLAVRGNPAFAVSTFEARRPRTSYTIDTLRALAGDHPRARLFLLLGEDSLREFHTWHEPESILSIATLVIAPRPSPAGPRRRRRPNPLARAGNDARSRRDVLWLDNPGFQLSSSDIRARARAGGSLRYLVPESVAAYVARHRLYRKTP